MLQYQPSLYLFPLKKHYLPFPMLIAAHAKFLGASLYTSAHHQPVAWLKNMQWAWDTGVGHSTHKDWDVFGQTGRVYEQKVKRR